LGRRIPGRHSEVGVTTKVSQQPDFIVEATPAAIRPRIVQRPVAVDEAECQLSFRLAQQTMLAVQYAAETADTVDKVLAAFAIVVKMNLDVRYSVANQFRQRFH
jgi:hypothetical protein